MTKAELVSKIAEKGGYTKKDAEKALSTVVGSITDVLTAGDKVTLMVSVLLRYVKELQRRVSTQAQSSLLRSLQRRFLHLRLVRHLKRQLLRKRSNFDKSLTVWSGSFF